MAIEDILRRIDTETEAAIVEKLDEARGGAEKVSEGYAARAKRLEDDLRRVAEKRALEEERRLIVNEQLEIRKAILTRKRAILDALYESARQRIGELKDDRYRKTIASLIIARAVSGTEEIVVPAKQRDLFAGAFLDDLNGSYPGGGRFTLASEVGDFDWGVVVREGKRTIDLTLEILFEQLRERIEPAIAAALFPARERRGKG